MAWDPFRELRGWHDRLERLASQAGDAWVPPIDVYETGDRYVVTAEVPGLVRDQIEIGLDEGRLSIQGHRSARTSGTSVLFHQIERGHGTFVRTFRFADRIRTSEVTADLEDGVLTITLPKMPPAPVRRVEVQ